MLAHSVAGNLLRCSPQQIAGWLKRAYPDNEDYHETISIALSSYRRVVPWRRSCWSTGGVFGLCVVRAITCIRRQDS